MKHLRKVFESSDDYDVDYFKDYFLDLLDSGWNIKLDYDDSGDIYLIILSSKGVWKIDNVENYGDHNFWVFSNIDQFKMYTKETRFLEESLSRLSSKFDIIRVRTRLNMFIIELSD